MKKSVVFSKSVLFLFFALMTLVIYAGMWVKPGTNGRHLDSISNTSITEESNSDSLMKNKAGVLPASSLNTDIKPLKSENPNAFGDIIRNSSSDPTVSITSTNNNFCDGGSATLSASATGDGTLTYYWTPGGATTSSISVSPSTSTQYKVTVTDENNISTQDSVMITVLNHTTSDTSATACTSFNWHGITYTTSGDKKDTILNAAGCDRAPFFP